MAGVERLTDMAEHPQTGAETDCEAGFMLIAVVVMVALVLIALAVAAPVVAKDLRRDKEVESQHRMKEYVRAIQLYQRKFPGQYPASIKVLEKTNNIRFLRRQWDDPLTGKPDWKLIKQGQQQTKIHVFFGEELAGLAASLGSAAGLASGPTGTGAAGTNQNNCISAGGLAGGFNGACQTSTTGGTGSTGTSGSTGSTGSAFGDGTGGVIVGVGTARTGESITHPNDQATYEQWEFWYDPRIELLKKQVNIMGGGVSSTDASNFGQGINGQPNGPSGATNGTGPTGTGPTAPTSPFGGGGFGSHP
jgi:type II secretory pathway pseudopilin PulG